MLFRRHFFGSDIRTLIILNDEMVDIMEIIKSYEESSFLKKGLSETIQNKAKEQKGGFFHMLLGTLGAALLRNMLASKSTIRGGQDL